MFRKISETFSATHLTIMFVAALIVPSALYATVATTAVSITDPNTGAKSYIDPARRMWINDPIASYGNNPANYVRISASCDNTTPGNTAVYTPPSGKSFIIKAIGFSYTEGTAGGDNSMILLLDNYPGYWIGSIRNTTTDFSLNVNLGNGFLLNNGETMKQGCSNVGLYSAQITGYLIPSNAAPSSAEMAAQSVHVGRALMKSGVSH